MRQVKTIAIFSVAAVLTACGGSSSGTDTPTEQPPETKTATLDGVWGGTTRNSEGIDIPTFALIAPNGKTMAVSGKNISDLSDSDDMATGEISVTDGNIIGQLNPYNHDSAKFSGSISSDTISGTINWPPLSNISLQRQNTAYTADLDTIAGNYIFDNDDTMLVSVDGNGMISGDITGCQIVGELSVKWPGSKVYSVDSYEFVGSGCDTTKYAGLASLHRTKNGDVLNYLLTDETEKSFIRDSLSRPHQDVDDENQGVEADINCSQFTPISTESMSYQNAIEYCNTMGSTLPTFSELSAVAPDFMDSAADACGWPKTHLWSSTTSGTATAYALNTALTGGSTVWLTADDVHEFEVVCLSN